MLRGLAARKSVATVVRRAAEERRFIPLLSKPVLDEYRAVFSDPGLNEKFPDITREVVEITLRRLRFVGDYVRYPDVEFEYRRDPLDQKFIELAIGLRATHILSYDKDLLSLPQSQGDAGRRFRQRLPDIRVMDAPSFLDEYGAVLRIGN
jgi:putative PIN family toxin of toxin-antitoxin system